MAQNRCVYVVATDDCGLFGSATVTVTVTLVNDETPMVSLPYTSIDFVEDSLSLRLFEPSAMVSIQDDDDNAQFLMAEANISLRYTTFTEWLMFDSVSFGLGNNINGGFDVYTGILTLMGPATVQQFEMVRQHVIDGNSVNIVSVKVIANVYSDWGESHTADEYRLHLCTVYTVYTTNLM